MVRNTYMSIASPNIRVKIKINPAFLVIFYVRDVWARNREMTLTAL